MPGIVGVTTPITSRAAGVRNKSRGGNPSKGNTTRRAGIAPTFTALTPPGGTHSVAYTYTFVATGDAVITYEITAGALPTGLTLNATTGVLAGTPGAGTAGTYHFTVGARNAFYPAATTGDITLVIA